MQKWYHRYQMYELLVKLMQKCVLFRNYRETYILECFWNDMHMDSNFHKSRANIIDGFVGNG